MATLHDPKPRSSRPRNPDSSGNPATQHRRQRSRTSPHRQHLVLVQPGQHHRLGATVIGRSSVSVSSLGRHTDLHRPNCQLADQTRGSACSTDQRHRLAGQPTGKQCTPRHRAAVQRVLTTTVPGREACNRPSRIDELLSPSGGGTVVLTVSS